MNFKPYFQQYEALVKMADAAFQKVKQQYPDLVKCRVQCSDCCFALFDLSLVEAIYINHYFNKVLSEEQRIRILEKANKADRMAYKIKRKAFKEKEAGKSEQEVFERVAKQRVRCPLLNDDNQCDLYDYRPITCRFYGIPTSIGGQAHTCGLSGFKPGEPYPTVDLDTVHNKLHEISSALVEGIGSKYKTLSEILVPLSMALLTNYNETYLGIPARKSPDEEN